MALFTISSDTQTTRSSVKSLFLFLSDFRNFKDILPEDKIEDFSYSEDECAFGIRGMTRLTVRRVSQQAYTHIHFATEGTAQFRFQLSAFFDGAPEQNGQCRIDLSGDLNPFIKAMAEKSLAALVNTMARKLSELTLNPV